MEVDRPVGGEEGEAAGEEDRQAAVVGAEEGEDEVTAAGTFSFMEKLTKTNVM